MTHRRHGYTTIHPIAPYSISELARRLHLSRPAVYLALKQRRIAVTGGMITYTPATVGRPGKERERG